MAGYVLIGGAWLGGWGWKVVARRLRGAGHDAYPVTLTGLGDRVHPASPEVDLETHVADLVNLTEYEDLRDVVLLGHSYASFVVTGVADLGSTVRVGACCDYPWSGPRLLWRGGSSWVPERSSLCRRPEMMRSRP